MHNIFGHWNDWMFHIMSVDDIKKNICKKNKKQLKNTFFILYLEQPGGKSWFHVHCGLFNVESMLIFAIW